MPNKDREIKAMAEVLMILTKEVVENPTFAIKDSFRYVHREVVTDTLASEAAYCDFLERTGLDIRKYDWYGGKVKTKDSETISINQLYTMEHMQTAKQFEIDLVNAYKSGMLTIEFIIDRLKKQHLCWVTKAEDKRLTDLGYRSARPDPEKAYREAGITICQKPLYSTPSTTKVAPVLKNTAARTMAAKGGIGESFTFINTKTSGYGVKEAYRAYNSVGQEVGFVFMTGDHRSPSYGYAELRFHTPYKGKTWCRFTTNGSKLSWDVLCQILSTKGKYKCYID